MHLTYNSKFLFISAIDDIINQIKGGRFTLKQTDVSSLYFWKYFCIYKLHFVSNEMIYCRSKEKRKEEDDKKRKARHQQFQKC